MYSYICPLRFLSMSTNMPMIFAYSYYITPIDCYVFFIQFYTCHIEFVYVYIYIYISIYFAVAAPQATGVGLQATAFVLQPEHVLKTTGIALQPSGFGRRRCSVCNSSQGVQYCSQRLYYCSQGSCYERQWLYYGYLSLYYRSQASALQSFVRTGCIICHKGCTMTQVGCVAIHKRLQYNLQEAVLQATGLVSQPTRLVLQIIGFVLGHTGSAL